MIKIHKLVVNIVLNCFRSRFSLLVSQDTGVTYVEAYFISFICCK